MRPGEAPTSWPRRPFASTLSPHRFRRLTEACHSYHGRSASHVPQPFLYLLFPYAIMPSPDACEQCVATLSRNEQKNARHDGTMARWHDGRILRQSFGPVPFHGKMAEICGCERCFANVSESENSDLGLCYQNRSTRQKKSPTTVHNRKSLPFFRIWEHDFLKSNGHSIKNGRQPAPAPKTKRLCPPGIRWQHPK